MASNQVPGNWTDLHSSARMADDGRRLVRIGSKDFPVQVQEHFSHMDHLVGEDLIAEYIHVPWFDTVALGDVTVLREYIGDDDWIEGGIQFSVVYPLVRKEQYAGEEFDLKQQRCSSAREIPADFVRGVYQGISCF